MPDGSRKTLPVVRPVTRADCANVPRPCPFRDCRYHLGATQRGKGPGRRLTPEQVAAVRADHEANPDMPIARLAGRHDISPETARNIARGKSHRKPRRADSPTESCTLDVADRGDHTLEEVGLAMGLTGAAVRLIEESAMRKLRHAFSNVDVDSYFADGPEGWTEPYHGPHHYGEED